MSCQSRCLRLTCQRSGCLTCPGNWKTLTATAPWPCGYPTASVTPSADIHPSCLSRLAIPTQHRQHQQSCSSTPNTAKPQLHAITHIPFQWCTDWSSHGICCTAAQSSHEEASECTCCKWSCSKGRLRRSGMKLCLADRCLSFLTTTGCDLRIQHHILLCVERGLVLAFKQSLQLADTRLHKQTNWAQERCLLTWIAYV